MTLGGQNSGVKIESAHKYNHWDKLLTLKSAICSLSLILMYLLYVQNELFWSSFRLFPYDNEYDSYWFKPIVHWGRMSFAICYCIYHQEHLYQIHVLYYIMLGLASLHAH